MKMIISKSKLDEWNFFASHRCVKTLSGTLKFEPLQNAQKELLASDEPMVYLWLTSISEESYEALYVGKAGLGVTTRLRGHENGFKNSVPGQKNASEILALLNQGQEVLVFARKAGVIEVLGRRINAYSAEEESIHEQYVPAWNRAAFAGGNRGRKAREGKNPVNNKNVMSGRISLSLSEEEKINLDFSEVLGGPLVSEFYEGLSSENKSRFKNLIEWAGNLHATENLQTKIVRGYQKQPRGYNKVATFLWSPLGEGGRAVALAWAVRIPLIATEKVPLSVTLPKKHMTANLSMMPSEDSEQYIAWGAENHSFRPINLDHFLKDPSFYTILT